MPDALRRVVAAIARAVAFITSPRRVAAQSVWARGALDHEPKKYRLLWRLWFPAYDVVVVIGGYFAFTFGSNLLYQAFGHPIVNAAGWAYAIAGLAALVGVAFPRLWLTEILGKGVIVGMMISYIACILLLPSAQQIAAQSNPSYFVATMLTLTLFMPLFRLSMTPDESQERILDQREASE